MNNSDQTETERPTTYAVYSRPLHETRLGDIVTLEDKDRTPIEGLTALNGGYAENLDSGGLKISRECKYSGEKNTIYLSASELESIIKAM